MTTKKLEEITGKLCDRYCIYSRILCHEDEQETLDEICKHCPMNEMFELLDMLLPCNIGDEVWILVECDGEYVLEQNKVTEVCSKGFFVSAYYHPPQDDMGNLLFYEEIGNTVFWDKAQAEKKIEEKINGSKR